MKTRMKRTLLVWMAVTIVFLSACPAGLAEAPGQAPGLFEARTYPYLQRLDDSEPVKESEMTLYFLNGGENPM